jgi:tRNA/rRNA methyltransferase
MHVCGIKERIIQSVILVDAPIWSRIVFGSPLSPSSMPAPIYDSLRNSLRVVLVRPSHPGNIGAAARAMRTMGLVRLALVQPKMFPDPQATAMAASATDVLEGARVCATLDEALEGTVLQVAFSARQRTLSHEPLDARGAAREILKAGGETALVFGNETYGLSNEEVMRCNRLASIPTDEDSSSLNLAAAVQVAVYELRMAWLDAQPETVGSTRQTTAPEARASSNQKPQENEFARHEDIERLLAHLERTLYASGFLTPENPRRLMERMRRLLSRANLEVEEVNILRGMLTQWDKSLIPILDKNARK